MLELLYIITALHQSCPQFHPSDFSVISSEDISTSDPEYGIQSSKTQVDMQNFVITGVVTFSNTNYWNDNVNYPAFVFDSNSNLWTPVQNYQSYLRNTLGKTSVTATLLSYEQAIENGCNSDVEKCSGSGFISEMNYWLGTSSGEGMVFRIGSDDYFGSITYT